MDGTIRANVCLESHVAIVLKNDQKTGKLTTGIVQRILTNSRTHPHGIKVRLKSGEIGRVKEILDQET
ncbi:MAG TPA: YwbE family protein [Methanosarcinaceae archaeon]|nr:YwbE family protein [Methanosarcinaceae archaeon]